MNKNLRNTVLIIASVITVFCVIVGSVGITKKASAIFSGISFEKTTIKDAEKLDGDINEIHLNMDLSDIKIDQGSENTISISAGPSIEPTMTFENGVLTVNCKEKVKVTPFNSAASDVVITLADDIDTLDIVCAAGDVEVSGVTAKESSVSVDLGDIDISNCDFANMSIESDLGDVAVKKVDFQTGNVVSAAGDVEFELPFSLEDCSFDVAVELGDVTIGKEEVGNRYKTSEGTKALSVSLDLGDLDIK